MIVKRVRSLTRSAQLGENGRCRCCCRSYHDGGVDVRSIAHHANRQGMVEDEDGTLSRMDIPRSAQNVISHTNLTYPFHFADANQALFGNSGVFQAA